MGIFEFDQIPEQPNGLPSLLTADLSTLDRAMYMDIWGQRAHLCQCCQQPLYEPLLFMFHHVLEKRVKKHASYVDYSMFRHCKWNIALLCWACHTTCDTNPASKVVASVMAYRDQLLAIVATEAYEYDSDHIWLKGDEPDLSLIQPLFAKFPVKLDT